MNAGRRSGHPASCRGATGLLKEARMMIAMRVRFDSEFGTVTEAIAKGWRLGARMLGFAVRQDAQQSIVPSRGISRPGDPPRSHDGTLRRFLLYSWDSATQSVVVGPKLLPKKSEGVATALEEGGMSFDAKGRTRRIQARPFMRPALGRVISTEMARLLADVVK